MTTEPQSLSLRMLLPLIAALALLGAVPSVAHGQDGACPESLQTVQVERSGQVIALALSGNKGIFLFFPQKIGKVDVKPDAQVNATIVSHWMLIYAKERSRPNAETRMTVTAGAMSVTLVFRNVESHEDVIKTEILIDPRINNAGAPPSECHKNVAIMPPAEGEAVSLSIPRGKALFVFFPELIEDFRATPFGWRTDVGGVKKQNSELLGIGATYHRLMLAPDKEAAVGKQWFVDVTTESRRTRLLIRVAEPVQDLKSLVYIRYAPDAPGKTAALPGEQQAPHKQQPVHNQPAPKMASMTAKLPGGVDREDSWRRELIPRRVTRLSGVLLADVFRGRWEGDNLNLEVLVRNQTAQPQYVKDARVSLGPGAKEQSATAKWELPATMREKNGAVMPPGSDAMMRLTVLGAARAGSQVLPLTMALVGDDGTRAGGMRLEEWEMYPVYAEQIEKRRRDEEASERVWLLGVGMAGFLWISNPADDTDLDAVTMIGGGMRAEYGFTRNLSVWGEGMGMQSSQAEFGEVTRQATIGRAGFGGLLKIGYETITSLRLGIGLQGARLGSETGEAFWSLEASTILGGGVARRLGDACEAGAAIVISVPWGDKQPRQVETSVHFGCSWKPWKPAITR